MKAINYIVIVFAITTAGLMAQTSDSFTRPDNTTAYGANDVVSDSTSSPTTLEFDVYGGATRQVIITGATVRVDNATLQSGASYVLHLYSAAPTAINDNVAFNLPSADRAKHLGSIAIGTPSDLGDTLKAQSFDLRLSFVNDDGATLYGILTTTGAYTPASADVYTVTLFVFTDAP